MYDLSLKKMTAGILAGVMALSVNILMPYKALAASELDSIQVGAWDQVFGGTEHETFTSVIQTADGGYVAAGFTYSPVSGEITDPYNGAYDGLLVKFDEKGQKVWDQVWGGREGDKFEGVMETPDGSLVVAGISNSKAMGEVTDPTNGGNDGLVVKFSAQGQPIWDRQFGGTSHDAFYAVTMAADGGYVAAGYTDSSLTGEITQKKNGYSDGLIVKFGPEGTVMWHQLYGGSDSDYLSDIISLEEGGFAIAGTTSSAADGDLTDTGNGSQDGLLAVIDQNGNPVWDQVFGGWSYDQFRSVARTSDQGFIVAGHSGSSATGEITDLSNGSQDGLLVRFDAQGNPLWDQLFGGSYSENFEQVIQTTDGGFIAVGYTDSARSGEITDRSNNSSGSYDAMAVRFSLEGNPVWDQLVGGWSHQDQFFGMTPTSDGHFAAAGTLKSETGEFTDQQNGRGDGFLVKFDTGELPVVTLHPEPAISEVYQDVTFTAAASGVPAPSLKWQTSSDGGEKWYDGHGESSITYSSDYAGRDILVRCLFTNTMGTVSSDIVTWKVLPQPSLQVIAGTTRFSTATALTQNEMSRDTAILVQSDNFPDALAAGPLAYALDAPIFLTNTASLNPTTQNELSRLMVKKVIIMGGPLAVGTAVEQTLRDLGYDVERIAGTSRYSTAALAAQALLAQRGAPEEAILVSGTQFPDALAIGSYAAKSGLPILLTDGKTLHASTSSYLTGQGIRKITIAGGNIPVSPELEASLISQGFEVTRMAGSNRQATSSVAASRFFPNAYTAIVASGWSFADALAAVPYAARLDAPILLVNRTAADQKVVDYLSGSSVRTIFVIGSDLAVAESCRNQLLMAITPN